MKTTTGMTKEEMLNEKLVEDGSDMRLDQEKLILELMEEYAKSYHKAEIEKVKEKVRGCKNLEPITPIDEGWDDAIDYVSGILNDSEEQQ